MSILKINAYSLAVLVIIFSMCTSMELYFTWYIPVSIANLACAVFLIPYFLKLRISHTSIFLVLSIIVVYGYSYTHNAVKFSFLSIVNIVSIILIVSFVILESDKFKFELYRGFDFFLKTVCFVSLFFWIIYLSGISLPHYYSDTSDFYSHDVYYFFLVGSDELFRIAPRFCGFFLEPGHVGSTACLLLYINRFDFKDKSNYIYLLSVIFSLSLAAYLLLFIGFCLYKMLNGVTFIKYIILLPLFAYLFYFIGLTYNDGDNIINEKILTRLTFVDGKLSGDNRTSKVFDFYYDQWLRNGDIIFGYGKEAYGDSSKSTNLLHGTASYKRFFFVNGVIGLLLVFGFYLLIFYNYPSRQGFGFFILYIICNMVRDYPLRMMWLFIFVLGIVKFFISENSKFCLKASRLGPIR